jgi:hypothetical protein
MVLIEQVKTFKKTNTGDVMGVIRTLFPNMKLFSLRKRKRRYD